MALVTVSASASGEPLGMLRGEAVLVVASVVGSVLGPVAVADGDVVVVGLVTGPAPFEPGVGFGPAVGLGSGFGVGFGVLGAAGGPIPGGLPGLPRKCQPSTEPGAGSCAAPPAVL